MQRGNGVNLLLHWQNKAEQLYSTGINLVPFPLHLQSVEKEEGSFRC